LAGPGGREPVTEGDGEGEGVLAQLFLAQPGRDPPAANLSAEEI
jgi:hypothetical protein